MDKNTSTVWQEQRTENTKSKKFSFYLLAVTCFLVALTILVTTFYSISCTNNLMEKYTSSVELYNNYITTTIAKTYVSAREKKSYVELNSLMDLLKKNYYVEYAYVYNVDSGKIIWASNTKYYTLTNDEVKKEFTGKAIERGEFREKLLNLGDLNMIVGLTQETMHYEIYKKMIVHLQIFTVLFLILGTIAAIQMSKKITLPLLNLMSGVKEFTKGNFRYRLQPSGYTEIDMLVKAYNRMAAQLNDLYLSLEKKVNERTIELENANKKLIETQTMMVHSEKMRSLGELVAGIAHEINNPINFVYGNIMILDNYQKNLIELINKYEDIEEQIEKSKLEEINNFKNEIDIEFIKDDISDLIKSCVEGVERTKNIVLDLKNFSRLDKLVFTECYIPKEIDTTLSILNNKIKNKVIVHKNYEQNFPKIEAYGGQLNQVFMNILDNAQDAIKDKGEIFINARTYDDDSVMIEFIDTGCGIKKEDLVKVFEPFYTTKPVGRGTGLGMSIAYRVIEAHNGKITVESEPNRGTKIRIILPIKHKDKNEAVV